MGSTWDAIVQADRKREIERADALERAGAAEQLGEDVAALRVTVHALEDRVELELGALSDELRQAIAKADDLAASRARASEERLLSHLGWLAQSSQRAERRLNTIAALVGFGLLLALFRC